MNPLNWHVSVDYACDEDYSVVRTYSVWHRTKSSIVIMPFYKWWHFPWAVYQVWRTL